MKSRFIQCFLYLVTLSTANLFGQTAVMPAGGGSSVNPYKISSLENLYWVTQNPNTWGSNFRQTADIDASSTSAWNGGEGFTPIGNTITPFTGTYSGNDGISSRKISNLYINRPATGFVGMFGYVTSGESILNLTLVNVNITGGDFVGGAIGAVAGGSDLRMLRLSVSGSVTGNGANVGGIVGRLESTHAEGLFFSTSHATVNGGSTVGGLVGYSTTIISKSSATGSVSGGINTGGLVGYMNNNDIEFSYASGAVNGSQFSGGFIGRTFGILTISDSYSAGTVTGTLDVGGFIGKVENSSSTIKSVVRSYASGDVNGTTNTGGFIGNNSISNITVENSYFNQTLSGQGSAVGTGSSTGITNLSDVQFRQKESYSGWDFFSTWDIYESTSTPYFIIATNLPEKNLTQFPAPTLVPFDGGDGSSGSPYQISTAAQLNAIRGNLSAYYILTNNIDLTETTTWHNGKGFEPIGIIPRSSIANSIPFTGQFDGGGFIISNMYISRSSDRYVGFFGAASNAVLKNIALTNVNITGNTYTGSIVGNLYNPDALINNSYASGTVTGNGRVGGLAGEIAGGTAVNNYTSVNVSGGSGNGGFVGGMSAATISNNYATGSVSGSSNIGGFYGTENIPKTLTNNYWNTETSGLEVGAGSGNTAGITGLTSSEMREVSSFSGFDFVNDWQNNAPNAFPTLKGIPGSPLSGYKFLLSSGSVSLDGIDDYISVAHSDDFDDLSEFTLEAWVYFNSNVRMGIIEKHQSPSSGWWVDFNTDISALVVTASGTRGVSSNTNPQINNWHHVAVTYSGTELALYLDGVDVSGANTGSGSGSILNNTRDIRIGDINWGSGNLDGKMDEVRIWNTVRTQDEIQRNMFQQLNGDEDGLTVYLPFDAISGTNALDKSPNEFAVSLEGAVVNSESHPHGTYITGSEGWRMMATPVEIATYGELLNSIWTQGFMGSDSPNNGNSTVYTWSESAQNFASIANATDIPTMGSGYLVYVYDDDDFDGTGDGFPKMIRNENNQRTGSISPTLSYTDTGNSSDDGWNLVGNPYGSTIDWNASSGWSTTAIDASVYVWSDSANSGAGDYLSWNGSTGTFGGGEIAPWQGFWVKANATSPSITLTDEVRKGGGVLRKKAPISQLGFTLKGETLSSRTILMLSENASSGKDPLDAYKLQSLNADYLSLFTQLEDGSGLDINVLPAEIQESISIPLGIDGSNLTGNFKLSWTPQNLPEGITMILFDSQTNTEINLTEASSYSFELGVAVKSTQTEGLQTPQHNAFSPKVMKAKTTGSRFMIIINGEAPVSNELVVDLPTSVELQQNYPNPFNPSTTINYGVPNSGKVTLEVFDILGRKVATLLNSETKTAGRYSINFNANNLSSGMYLYRLQAGNSIIIKKLTLIK